MSFKDIPVKYKSDLSNIFLSTDKTIQKVYSQFEFHFFDFNEFPCSKFNDKDSIKTSLLFFTNENKFFTYQISPTVTEYFINIIFCVENHCFILEMINDTIIRSIIDDIKVDHIEISPKISLNKRPNSSMIDAEVDNFCLKFNIAYKNNQFLKYTIKPMILYLIRRYYYPSSYFKDPSFFIFDQENDLKEEEVKKNLQSFLKLKNLFQIKSKSEKFKKSINVSIENQINKIHIFNEKDFIELRDISISNYTIKLVLHRPTFYLFAMKKFSNTYSGLTHEIDFCEKYSHRCFTRFYGFLQKNEEIYGFIYEFMSNGTLSSLISKGINSINQFAILIRIIQGINFLQSNSLIHRDLKPNNILIDHDNNAYISDFNTIRSINNDQDENFTTNLGSLIYTSNEQMQGLKLTFKTDIYSFGCLIYYIFEKKNMFESIETNIDEIMQKKNNQDYPQITNCSNNIQKLYMKCIKNDPNERPEIKDIINVICNETESDNILHNYCLKQGVNPSNIFEFVQYLYENILLRFKFQRKERAIKYIGDLAQFHIYNKIYQIHIAKTNDTDIYKFVTKEGYSQTLVLIGNIYFNGDQGRKYYDKTLEYFNLAAELNNATAFANLGYLYLKGIIVNKDYRKSLEYFEKAEKQNHPSALFNLGIAYLNGKGVVVDFAKAKMYFERAASQDTAKAYHQLGFMYHLGLGVEKNDSVALYYYEYAAEKGVKESMVEAGLYYESGFYVEKDYEKARDLYEKAAGKKYSYAYFCLGHLYENSDYEYADPEIAIYYYKMAEKMGNQKASVILCQRNPSKSYQYMNQVQKKNHKKKCLLFEGLKYHSDIALKKGIEFMYNDQNNQFSNLLLGNDYLYGISTKKDYEKSKKIFEKMAHDNVPEGYFKLGELYYCGFGVDRNFLLAKSYFEKAARVYYEKSNHKIFPPAITMIGIIYYYGYGVKTNFEISKECFEICAKENYPLAILMLGTHYCNGNGVSKDYKKAMDYYQLAAKYQEPLAIYKIGTLYLDGLGVQVDYKMAEKYFLKSAGLNCADAFLKLGDLYFKGKVDKVDYLKAISYYEKSAEGDHFKAHYKLGKIYQDGICVNQDYEKAKKCYLLSAKYQYPKAYLKLGDLYFNGLGMMKDYKQARYYYEVASSYWNRDALFQLGYIYENGLGVQQNYKNAIYYYDLSVKFKNTEAIFRLENIYTFGKGVEIDISKAFYYLSKIFIIDKFISKQIREDGSFYIANNNLGLIYLFQDQNNQKAFDYIKEAALAEYPFAQNNYGLLCQFFSNVFLKNKKVDIEYFYTKSMKNNFAMAFYNLGYLYEKENQKEKSIELYIKASEYENEPLMFRNRQIYDEQLERSKSFIICLTNLKLAYYYYQNENLSQGKNYFTKAFSKLVKQNNTFCHHEINENQESFSFLHEIIFNYPDFGFTNKVDNIKEEPKKEVSIEVIEKTSNNNNNESSDLANVLDFVDYVVNHKYLTFLLKEIAIIIDNMNKILYQNPYSILFGRIQIKNSNLKKMQPEIKKIDINEWFYKGFSMNNK